MSRGNEPAFPIPADPLGPYPNGQEECLFGNIASSSYTLGLFPEKTSMEQNQKSIMQ